MPTPSQLPERLRVTGEDILLPSGEVVFDGELWSHPDLPRRIVHRYNAHDALLQELEELRKALDAIRAQRNNRYESTVKIMADIADKALGTTK